MQAIIDWCNTLVELFRYLDYLNKRWFYRVVIWQLETDYVIGRNTGRNPEVVGQDKQDLRKWEGILHKLEVNQCLST